MDKDPMDDAHLLASLETSGIRLWLDQGVLMVKTVEPYDGPIELNNDETDKLIEALHRLRKKMED